MATRIGYVVRLGNPKLNDAAKGLRTACALSRHSGNYKTECAIRIPKNQQAELFSVNQWLERYKEHSNHFQNGNLPSFGKHIQYNVNINTYLLSAKQQTRQNAMNRVQNNKHHIRLYIWLLTLQLQGE